MAGAGNDRSTAAGIRRSGEHVAVVTLRQPPYLDRERHDSGRSPDEAPSAPVLEDRLDLRLGSGHRLLLCSDERGQEGDERTLRDDERIARGRWHP